MLGALARFGLLRPGETPRFTALTGGVSSDIWRVDLESGPVCIKRALPKLKVAADWEAPVERNAYEVAWYQTAGAIVPEAAPRVLGHDPEAGLFVMEFLDPTAHRLWKEELRAGRVERSVARAVGERIGRIHAGTAGIPSVATRFNSDAIFHPIRLEPYLLATAKVHPDRADVLEALVQEILSTKRALVHGDVSPKNVLIGPSGPVLLDAECAWYGDPAFDLAFCLNHLLLKCLWTPASANALLDAFGVLADSYLNQVSWEAAMTLEKRAAHLLPGLFLARVDGKSPVEYLTDENDKERVRRVARALLADPVDTLAGVRAAWAEELGR